MALRDADDQVRISAASRLGCTGRADAIAALATLAADPVPRVRPMVAYALGQLRKVEATPVLLRLRHDPDRHVRENALEALGSVGGAAAVDALLLIAADEDPLRAQAARALGRAVDSDPRTQQQLTTLAQDDEPAVRAATTSGAVSTDSVRFAPGAVRGRAGERPRPGDPPARRPRIFPGTPAAPTRPCAGSPIPSFARLTDTAAG
ncbi:HEAT repeat domain-containing protein [Micromonospora chalcea]|uniref:HEAT repeat domain-containing protein n=1 Tax=Micromonospora chalcea TaxID=1874 RepID=UPI002378C8F1|nr:HEAT repeat domain-containing protein [Micromonospora chalcea]WDQ02208.1 HEAT repeat domain-containing protein [Micromonospora chalcea]